MARASSRLAQLIKSRHFNENPVGLLGMPLHKGQPRAGVHLGPGAIRNEDLINKLRRTNRNITDLGDVEVVDFDEPRGKIRQPLGVGLNNQKLCTAVKKAMHTYHTVINLGGDHSMAMGTIAGHAASLYGQAPAVIWVDAHADINTPESTWSGNLHGQPVSFLLGEFEDSRIQLSGFDWLQPVLSAGDIAYIGLRDLDDAEVEYLDRLNILYYTADDVRDHGIRKVLSHCVNHVDPENKRQFHLSFDIDALDPSIAPATGTAVPNGLTLEEGEFICEELAKTNRLRCVDLVEVNPELSDDEGVKKTIDAAISLIQHCTGKRSNHKL